MFVIQKQTGVRKIMINKNIYSFLLIFTLLFCFSSRSFAHATPIPQKDANVTVSVESEEDIESEETDIIKKISFRNRFKKSPEAQIRSFFKKYNRYSERNNIEKLKDMYTDEYVNNDGFNKKTVFELIKTASDAYKDITYTTQINSIKICGNYAVVQAHETASGLTSKKVEKIDDYGQITSDIYYTDYLKKEGNKWKITATVVTSEYVSLAYGEAKNMTVEMSAPEAVPEGAEYEVNVKTTSPDGAFLVGSIVNDQIVFPQVDTKDVFRSVKSGELARILTANKDKNNEYATVSLAITRAQIEPPSVILNMTGMAFVMKRVNIIKINENVKLDKEAEDGETTK